MAPSLVLVPGSTATPLAYRSLVLSLSRALPSLSTFVVPLPSVGKRPSPTPTLYDDAGAVSFEVRKLVDAGEEVIVMAHSYGGIVATQALKGLTKVEREKEGKEGGVVRVVWIAALICKMGECPSDVFKAEGEWGERETRETYVVPDPVVTAPILFNDVEDEAKRLEYAQLFIEQATGTRSDRLTWEGFRTVKHTYVLCLRDLVVAPELQRGFVQTLTAATKEMGEDWVDVVELDAGHAPTQSRVEEMVGIVKGLVGDA